MPRKRRPTPPLPGSIVRNLAPKPDPNQSVTDDSSERTAIFTSSSSRQSTVGSDIESSACGVPQCTLPNCQLPTHINYGQQRRLMLLQGRNSGSPQSPQATLTEASSRLSVSTGIDGTMKLPIDDTPNRDFQRLFLHFFNVHFDAMMLIFRPQLKDPAFKQTIYRLALHNPVYCLTIVAQAHMNDFKDGAIPADVARDSLTDTIYTKILKMTREKVESFELDDIDVLLMAIVVLCEYDLHLHQYDALSTHHIGMKALVSKRGGIHNLGLSLPYVLRMDRFLAVRSNSLPQFASPDIAASSFVAQKVEQGQTYGSAFEDLSSHLSPHVKSVCSDAAHLLELMDELAITFDASKVREGLNPKMEYFYFLRENIEVRYSILNHQTNQANAKININRLVLCAAHLVTYHVAQANYLPLVTDLLATRLWNMLTQTPSRPSSANSPPGSQYQRSDSGEHPAVPTIDLADWKDNLPTLLWLLFACALPASRTTQMSFTGHLASALSSPGLGQPKPASRSPTSSRPQANRSITSPSSPRRHRYLPSFILYVAEHLVGERPLSGTRDWDEEVIEILETFVWASDRLTVEYRNIMTRVHEGVLTRADE